mmetsp:Transcript_25466/g.46028  ORF Transcript_25466/g.46028 Transcript_25466/m.46028 type:complete len:132 (+) Transcript_25466:33-428(+)
MVLRRRIQPFLECVCWSFLCHGHSLVGLSPYYFGHWDDEENDSIEVYFRGRLALGNYHPVFWLFLSYDLSTAAVTGSVASSEEHASFTGIAPPPPPPPSIIVLLSPPSSLLLLLPIVPLTLASVMLLLLLV